MKHDPMHRFWKTYVESDSLERDKILKKIVKFPIWQETLAMHKLNAKKIDGLTVQEYCLKTNLMSYFDDLIEYIESRK
jgi:DNA-directed RNA polymerase subunit N (RpoN/RPB10)